MVGYLFSGKGGQKVEQVKPPTAKASAAKPETSEKPKPKVEEPSKDEDDDSDDSEDDESDENSEDESDEVSCFKCSVLIFIPTKSLLNVLTSILMICGYNFWL